MKTKLMYPLLLIVLYAFAGALTASAQFAHIRGKVTDKGQPLAGVQVIYKSANTGKIVKVKTDSKGEFFSIGVPDDVYNVSVIDASGKTIYTHDKITVAQGGDDVDNILNIDLTNGVTVKTPGGASNRHQAGRSQRNERGGGETDKRARQRHEPERAHC
jgi:hypothetical protein